MENTVLLLMDMQRTIVNMVPGKEALISSVQKAIAAARAKNIPIIYVVVGFRAGMPEVSMYNKGFAASKERMMGNKMDMTEWMHIEPSIAPGENDLVVTKRRVSAFTGSDLQVILSALNARHLVIGGISTTGVVLSTVREAADKDYVMTILSDACADTDEEVHNVVMNKVLSKQAEIVTVDDWAK
jgi:nicotinamidase-related amidase